MRPKSNPARTPAPYSIYRGIRELRNLQEIYAVAYILRYFSPAPVPWMTLLGATVRSSLRHEAVLNLTHEPGAPVARWHRVRDATRVLTAKKPLAGISITTKAYTCPATGRQPES